uniref:Uncharacterized protein n=1 Tax=Spongospora subterranea TaxID=70186 RepID=A0A0H5QHY9_9EUKA|eukprot:CRZ01262.1 hypothetical protein [Spongospora subterranea]
MSKKDDLKKLLFDTSRLDRHTAMFKRFTVYFGLPAIAVFGVYNVFIEMNQHKHSDFRKPDFSYLNVRKKAFPWEFGDRCSLLDLKCRRQARLESIAQNRRISNQKRLTKAEMEVEAAKHELQKE